MRQVFLSVAISLHNHESELGSFLRVVVEELSKIVTDFEIIVVDNASDDGSVATLKKLTQMPEYPNIQVFALTSRVDEDTANWVALENALGDFVVVFDPLSDGIHMIPKMLNEALSGADVVFVKNTLARERSILYRACFSVFDFLFRLINGVSLSESSPRFRMVSRRFINFILRHHHPVLVYRHVLTTGGFVRSTIEYSYNPFRKTKKSLNDGLSRAFRLLFSTSQAPLRTVAFICLFGAFSNVVYSAYVLGVALFKSDVAPGWVSLSLQQSGMFFLISVVLFVLGEYVVINSRATIGAPLYHVGQEFLSSNISHRKRLNVEDDLPSNSKI
ncbi:MAG: glycosyltransferase [Bdellovibrionaceae bacterium]|nr:glycosyltransferase [Pseudobdellovibrionaceae bacterium]